jgi:hypothetical protein
MFLVIGTTARFRLHHLATLAVLSTGVSGCGNILGCKDTVQMVNFGPILDGNTQTLDPVFWPGDTYALVAVAGGDETNEFCPGHVMYTSATSPEQFQFNSSDPSVATVSGNGTVTAINLGTTKISVESNGVATTTSLQVRVAQPIVQMRYTANPPIGKVGDTVAVTLHPIGPDGLPVVSPAISPMRWTGPGVSDGQWLKGWVSTTENSFVATVAGQLIVTTSVLHAGHPSFVSALQYIVQP